MFVVFDLETTGLSEINNDVIQLAYILFDNDNHFVRAETLYFYYEGMSWTEEAFKIHNIPLEFLRTQADKFQENLIKAYSVLNRANVIGHNSEAFDCPFIRTWLRRMGISGLEFGIRNDTMKAFTPITHRARISLNSLCDKMGITPDYITTMVGVWFGDAGVAQRHNAAYDVTATALLTLNGIRQNLIAFESPMEMYRKANLMKEPDDIQNVNMLANDEAKPVDPKRIIVELQNIGESSTHFAFTNSDINTYADTTPIGSDVLDLSAQHRMFPEVFMQSEQDENIYTLEHEGTTYVYIRGAESYTLTIKTQFGVFEDKDVDMSKIIMNNFKEEKEDA